VITQNVNLQIVLAIDALVMELKSALANLNQVAAVVVAN